MGPEKILVVYFSRTGNTRILANELSRKLQCDIEEIKTPVSYSGFWGYQRALLQATFKRKPVIRPLQKDPTNYDLVIIGSPLWGGSISAPIRSFFEKYGDSLNDVAFFSTRRGGFGRTHFFEQMRQLSKKKPMSLLTLTEKELNSGEFKKNMSSFLSILQAELERRREKVGKIRPKIVSRPDIGISL